MGQFQDDMRAMVDVNNLVFRIGELSKMTGVSARQLRYWEAKGYIHSLDRADGQQARVYGFQMFIKVSMMKYFLDEGYTLTAAQEQAMQRRQRFEQLHRFIRLSYQGFGEIDGRAAINLGPFDDHQTLFALIDQPDRVDYRLIANDDVAKMMTETLG